MRTTNKKSLINLCIIFSLFIVCSSCENKQQIDIIWQDAIKDTFDNLSTIHSNHGFYDDTYGICLRSCEKHDVKVEIKWNGDYQLQFFNYEPPLTIVNHIAKNVFYASFSRHIILSIISPEDIVSFHEEINNKYKLYGIAKDVYNTDMYTKNVYGKNVITTPLATKYLNEGKLSNDGCLLFVRFDNGDEYKDYIFYGGDDVEYLVKNRYHNIIGTNIPYDFIFPLYDGIEK